MRKVFSVLLFAVMLFTLTACGNNSGIQDGGTQEGGTQEGGRRGRAVVQSTMCSGKEDNASRRETDRKDIVDSISV